jgi:hypothetical protein
VSGAMAAHRFVSPTRQRALLAELELVG